jgi:hypothetical protein
MYENSEKSLKKHCARNVRLSRSHLIEVFELSTNVFFAVEPQAGQHFTLPTPNRSAAEFAQALETIVSCYPGARTIHLVMDNLNIHGRKPLTDYFGEQRGARSGTASPPITRPSSGDGESKRKSRSA